MVNKMKEENMSGTVFFPWAESTETRSFTIIYVIYLWVGYDGAVWVKLRAFLCPSLPVHNTDSGF